MNTFGEYQESSRRTMAKFETKREELMALGLELAGECGELVELIKKLTVRGKEIDQDWLAEEAGDCLWALTALLSALDLKLENVAIGNVEKLRVRYPTHG